MKTADIESAVVNYFSPLRNLIVPNVSYGLDFLHECDLLVLTPAGYAYEVEIKTSRADLIRDKQKKYGHNSRRIKGLYFAIPVAMTKDIEHVPERAGVLVVTPLEDGRGQQYFLAQLLRKPQLNGKYKFSVEEKYKMARLGAIKIWDLKRKISQQSRELKGLREVSR